MDQKHASGTISNAWRRHIWLRPLIVSLVLAAVGWQLRANVEASMKRGGQPVSPELETLLMRCLAKSASARPASADELIAALANLPTAASWTDADARRWWRRYLPNLTTVATPNSAHTAELSATVVADHPAEI